MTAFIGRREFITLLGGAAAAWPLAARAQQRERMRRIGVLMSRSRGRSGRQARLRRFAQGLQRIGLDRSAATCGSTIAGRGRCRPTARKYAAELVALAPDVILAIRRPRRGGVAAGDPHRADRVRERHATRSAPASSRAWRGRAATSPDSSMFEYGMSGKWLELLKEIAPRVTRVGGPSGSRHAAGTGQFGAIQAVGAVVRRGGRARSTCATPSEIERAVAAFRARPNGGLIVTASPLGDRSSRPDHRAGGPAPVARDLLRSAIRHRRRPDLLWDRSDRPVPARGRLRRSHPQGREAGRPAGAGSRPSSSWSSTSRPPRRSASTVPPTLLARADEVIE